MEASSVSSSPLSTPPDSPLIKPAEDDSVGINNWRLGKRVFALLCEKQERYDEMFTCMKGVAKLGEELTIEERSLLCVAFTKALCIRRTLWDNLYSIEQDDELKGAGKPLDIIRRCCEEVEKDLKHVCLDVLGLLNDYLIPKAESGESKVVYYKMSGDFYGYLAEVASEEEELKVFATAAHEAYEKATDFAQTELTPTHIFRLALALNFSIFCCNLFNKPNRGRLLAKNAIEEYDAVGEDTVNEDTIWIMQRLRKFSGLQSSHKSITPHTETNNIIPNDTAPCEIFSGKFNGVPVYIYQFGLHSYVMRRCHDDWINASHILTVANFDKNKRTSYLQKLAYKGEKVQGGNWKYQGTWVPLNQAKKVAHDVGVYEKIRDILEFRPKREGRRHK